MGAFHQNRVDVTETDRILSACRQMFTTHFTKSKVEFSRRQANEVAHTLTGVATLSASLVTYGGEKSSSTDAERKKGIKTHICKPNLHGEEEEA